MFSTTMFRGDRMLQLAEFLDQLSQSEFYFASVISQMNEETGCGTVCCAIGWTPAVFPDLVRWPTKSEIQVDGSAEMFLLDRPGEPCFTEVAAQIFRMPEHHAEFIFSPGHYSPADGSELEDTATPQEVAERIRTYVEWRYEEDPSLRPAPPAETIEMCLANESDGCSSASATPPTKNSTATSSRTLITQSVG